MVVDDGISDGTGITGNRRTDGLDPAPSPPRRSDPLWTVLFGAALALSLAGTAHANDAPASAGSDDESMVIHHDGLQFDVEVDERSLRERDPRLDRVIQDLPIFGNSDTQFQTGWTEKVAASARDQTVNGPAPCVSGGCVGAETLQRRMSQMDMNNGPQDDWTWTPPSR